MSCSSPAHFFFFFFFTIVTTVQDTDYLFCQTSLPVRSEDVFQMSMQLNFQAIRHALESEAQPCIPSGVPHDQTRQRQGEQN